MIAAASILLLLDVSCQVNVFAPCTMLTLFGYTRSARRKNDRGERGT